MMFKLEGWKVIDEWLFLIYVYGGLFGIWKMVVDGSYVFDVYFFVYYMVKKYGMLMVIIDLCGFFGYGGVFEKVSYEQIGKFQVEDFVDGIKFFIEEYGVDENCVVIYGWLFGGF